MCIIILLVTIFNFCYNYQVGVGIADVTGPPLGVTFLGYGKFQQRGHGIHTRQFARSFIICDENVKSNCSVLVSVDVCMITSLLRQQVLTSLIESYKNLYNENNVALIATHTHSTPGGYNGYTLYNIPNFGFNNAVFTILHTGILKAIHSAHNNLRKGHLYFNSGVLLNTNINRSPAAYLLNPEYERNKYEHNVDKTIYQIKIEDENGTLMGLINWFPVHGTSMHNTNKLISSDNFGCASIFIEKKINKNSIYLGQGPFVAAFLPSNMGDVSPNTLGEKCFLKDNLTCDPITSKCQGHENFCYAQGPGQDMFQSTKIICNSLANKALELSKHGKKVFGDLNSVHRFVDMPKQTIKYNDTITTCHPALGYAFAAGTADGPGLKQFSQGKLKSSVFWNIIGNVITETPKPADIHCHFPKPILLNGGTNKKVNEFIPSITSIQILQIGFLYIICVPGELTTMSGRRLRNTLMDYFINSNSKDIGIILITSLSNDYINYITTKEEYNLQRYEGGATLFGPNELMIFQKLYLNLLKYLVNNEILEPESEAPKFNVQNQTFLTKVDINLLRKIECIKQPNLVYKINETATATFTTTNPNRNILHSNSYFFVEKKINNKWNILTTDADWYTKIHWEWSWFYFDALIEVDLDNELFSPGIYRITFNGQIQSDSNSLNCSSNEFKILP